jgi:K+-sensing histidine kinase KdpD
MKFSEFKKNVDEKNFQNSSVDKARNLEFILEVTRSINQTLILEDVLQLVLKSAIELTKSERGFIVLIDESGTLEFKMGMNGNGEMLDESFFKVSTSVVEDVFKTGFSRFIESAQSDRNNDPSRSILQLDLQTILCSPLITNNKKIGVIYVDSKHLHKVKVKELTDTFEILAGQAATAINNAQLYIGQVNANNTLQEVSSQLIQAERKVLKTSIGNEVGRSLQGLVHIAQLETESMMRTIEKLQSAFETEGKSPDEIFFDRLKLKSKITIDSIRSIQKYAQVLLEASAVSLDKGKWDLNATIQRVIKYLSAVKKFSRVSFKPQFNALPVCYYDNEQIEHLLVQLFTNSAEVKADAQIAIITLYEDDKISVIVSDNGPGISPEKHETLFEPPSPGKKSYGLFLCKSIMDHHNGEISIVNSEAGAAIKFSMPVK